MQRAKLVSAYGQDLKEAISEVKAATYRQLLASAGSLDAVAKVEHEIRSDFQLTGDDRVQLLGEVERAISGP